MYELCDLPHREGRATASPKFSRPGGLITAYGEQTEVFPSALRYIRYLFKSPVCGPQPQIESPLLPIKTW